MAQVGLQGVDNGALRFSNVRIPRGNLLDRFGQVDRAGNYTSAYTLNRRFAATLGELTGGRVGLTCGSLGILKVRATRIGRDAPPPPPPVTVIVNTSSCPSHMSSFPLSPHVGVESTRDDGRPLFPQAEFCIYPSSRGITLTFTGS